MSAIMEWDELNIIRETAVTLFGGKRKSREDILRFCDYLEYVLCLVYAYGWKDAEEVVGAVPFRDGLDDKAVNLPLEDGKTFRDRITEDTTQEEILRLIDTEAHRDYNTGVYDAATISGKSGIRKQWYTMMDDRVRDTHRYLEGVTVGLNDRFWTYDGDSALYPGGFMLPSNNVNCRCIVRLSTGG